MKWLVRLLRAVFGGVFVYAGALKAWNPQAFLEDVRSFDLLGDPWAAWLAMGLPWLEIFAGMAVITGALRRGGLLILNGALLAFLGAIALSWYRSIDIRCGCFGSSTATSNYIELLVRDVLLLALGLWLFLRRR